MIKTRPLRVIGMVVTCGAVLSLLAPAHAVSAQLPPPPPPPPPPGGALTVELLGSGELVGRGEAVTVPVSVTCDPSPFPGPFPGGPSVSVSLTQRWGNDLAQGYGSESVRCDGTPVVVDVLVRGSDRPFKQGDALATASMFTCDFFGCRGVMDTEVIRIKKNKAS